MPKFEFDPSKVSAAGIPVLDPDSYTFEIGEPKSFARKNQKGEDSYGVMFPLMVVGGNCDGKRVYFNTYMQSEGGQSALKRFLMTALGFNPRTQEAEFNDKYSSMDWSIDPDNNKAVGSVYAEAKGKLIIGELGVKEDTNDPTKRQQDWKNWLVYGG